MHIRHIMIWEFKHTKATAEKMHNVYGEGLWLTARAVSKNSLLEITTLTLSEANNYVSLMLNSHWNVQKFPFQNKKERILQDFFNIKIIKQKLSWKFQVQILLKIWWDIFYSPRGIERRIESGSSCRFWRQPFKGNIGAKSTFVNFSKKFECIKINC